MKDMEITEKHVEEFVAAAREVGRRGLTRCSSGNLSWRIGDLALVSATGAWLPELKPEDIAVCRMEDGVPVNGVKPSMESVFHLSVLRNRPEIRVVLHCQSIYATTVACMKHKPDNFHVTAEIALHCGDEIAFVPYLRPGSPALARAVEEALQHHEAVLMENHGQVYAGKDFREVIQRAEFLEMVCQIMILSGMNFNTIAPAALQEWKDFIRYHRKPEQDEA